MSVRAVTKYLSIGGNRHTAASAWSSHSNILAFGADQNVALWHPVDGDRPGIRKLLHGHKDRVGVIQFLKVSAGTEYLISGAADGRLVLWRLESPSQAWKFVSSFEAHTSAVNSIASLDGSGMFVTGGANCEIKLWRIREDNIELITTIAPKPKFIPLALVLGKFHDTDPEDGIFLISGGTRNEIYVYTLSELSKSPTAKLQATLRGHEGWIHSLALKTDGESDLLLASASHDKYVRLWRFQLPSKTTAKTASHSVELVPIEATLTAKVQTVSVNQDAYSITFEALLLGHEDWVYSAAWNPAVDSDQLMTASADGSLAIWELDPSSGIWISASKLGEISDQKGATTATGSSGGFWTGIWSPDGGHVTCLGRTGSWRLWRYDSVQQYWKQRTGVTGHIGSANGLSWSPGSEYLLSTSSDQTTRLHAEWRRSDAKTWHEFSRPQIHGYDLNCIALTNSHQFASGADEKLLRVFNEPKDVAEMLQRLSGISKSSDVDLPDTAAMPVLGLSNKAMGDEEDTPPEGGKGGRDQEYITSTGLEVPLPELAEPPTEDVLSRHTLWPEHEKLYGHGYEISECSHTSEDGLLATACKASSTDHAVIRLYDTNDWHEIKPSLTAHSLTITRLRWSLSPNRLLLSVGRDRQWAVFGPSDQDNQNWTLLQSNPKAHTRMILDAAWSPTGTRLVFATAGRDKTIKLWHDENSSGAEKEESKAPNFRELLTIKRESAITALDFGCDRSEALAVLAAGEDNGKISIHVFDLNVKEDRPLLIKSVEVSEEHSPSKAVTKLAWRGRQGQSDEDGGEMELAVSAADGSVRIIGIDIR